MDPLRIHRNVREQGLERLLRVSVGIVRGDKPLISPPEVNFGPVDGGRRRRVSNSLERADTHRAAGQDHGSFTVLVLDINKLGDQARRNGRHKHGRIRMNAYSWLNAHWVGRSLGWYVAGP